MLTFVLFNLAYLPASLTAMWANTDTNVSEASLKDLPSQNVLFSQRANVAVRDLSH